MSKRRRPTRRRPGERFIAFQFWELECPAFMELSADATRVYLFMRKRLSFDCSNNGAIPFSHRDAADVLKSAWRRGSNALAELAHYRFIKLRDGGEPGPNIRRASEWQITAFPCGGQSASKDFMSWQGEPFSPPHRRDSGSEQKQRPIFTVKTPRRHGEDAAPVPRADSRPKKAESVGTVKTLRHRGRRHGEDTITDTTRGGATSAPDSLRAGPGAKASDPVVVVGGSPGSPDFNGGFCGGRIRPAENGDMHPTPIGPWFRQRREAAHVDLALAAEHLKLSPKRLQRIEAGELPSGGLKRSMRSLADSWGNAP